MDRKEIGVDSVTGREGNKFKEKGRGKMQFSFSCFDV